MKTGLLIAFMFLSSLANASSDAVYEVPGSKPGQGLYDMSLKLYVDGDVVFAGYDLPQNLTGVKNRIEMSGTFINEGLVLLQGPKGELRCNFQEEKCDARYKDIIVDLDAVKARLERAGLAPNEVMNGLTISRRFQRDPIGVIHLIK